MVVSQTSVLPALERVLDEARKRPDYKVMVFLPTAKQARLFATVFRAMRYHNICEIHSRLSQSLRDRTAATFRASSQSIMFTSDVSARGVDYPDVTLVVQVGITDAETYVHRLGRTGRAGKAGSGLLLLADYEQEFMIDRVLRDMPLQPSMALPSGSFSDTNGKTVVKASTALATVVNGVRSGASEYDAVTDACMGAYTAWCGFLKAKIGNIMMSKADIAMEANALFLSYGLREPPMIPASALAKMGLSKVPGFRVEALRGTTTRR